jgi:hypothetical protein
MDEMSWIEERRERRRRRAKRTHGLVVASSSKSVSEELIKLRLCDLILAKLCQQCARNGEICRAPFASCGVLAVVGSNLLWLAADSSSVQATGPGRSHRGAVMTCCDYECNRTTMLWLLNDACVSALTRTLHLAEQRDDARNSLLLHRKWCCLTVCQRLHDGRHSL